MEPIDIAFIEGMLLALGKPQLAIKLRAFAEPHFTEPIPAAFSVAERTDNEKEGLNPPGPRYL